MMRLIARFPASTSGRCLDGASSRVARAHLQVAPPALCLSRCGASAASRSSGGCAAGWPSDSVGLGRTRSCGAVAARSGRTRRRHAAAAAAAEAAADAEENGGDGSGVGDRALPNLQIIYRDEHIVAIEKPSGYFVHPPEDGFPFPQAENLMRILRRQLGGDTWIYPVHRLDRPTAGVLVYCLTKEAASGWGRASRERRIDKTYVAMVRGLATPYGIVDKEVDGATAISLYETLATVELPVPVGKYPVARYSLLKVKPLTGAFHQIRRHLNRCDRPIIGDTDHGDRAHNRLWSGPTFNATGLFLKCTEMAFDHPVHGPSQRMVLSSSVWEPRWAVAFGAFGVCPTDCSSDSSAADIAGQLGLDYGELMARGATLKPNRQGGRRGEDDVDAEDAPGKE
ncbi:hypothetical protein FOA52_008181 [Chlamydomonas sp. UWO 241]|nr:hypothetical protein FOA52_008181 [Chlamydomonas sp. UWO 241]